MDFLKRLFGGDKPIPREKWRDALNRANSGKGEIGFQAAVCALLPIHFFGEGYDIGTENRSQILQTDRAFFEAASYVVAQVRWIVSNQTKSVQSSFEYNIYEVMRNIFSGTFQDENLFRTTFVDRLIYYHQARNLESALVNLILLGDMAGNPVVGLTEYECQKKIRESGIDAPFNLLGYIIIWKGTHLDENWKRTINSSCEFMHE